MNKYAIIMAAGKGTRMKSKRDEMSKVSFPILGRPMVKYVLEALRPLGFNEIVTIVGFGGKMTEEIVTSSSKVVWQKEQKGTGHAVMMTSALLKDKKGETIICCGDTPLLTCETLSSLLKEHEENNNDLTILTSIMDNPKGYGRIVKENGKVIKIVEQKDCSEEEALIKEVNAGVYVFDNEELFKDLERLTPNNAAGEYYLTDVIGMFVNDGKRVCSFSITDVDETMGVNDRYHLSIAAKKIQQRINKNLMLSGVTIEDPDSTYISPDSSVGVDCAIRPNTYILKGSKIGEGNIIGPSTYLENAIIGNDNEIIFSNIKDSTIGNRVKIGPYSNIRNNSKIEDEAVIGNFNELKNTTLGPSSKCCHLSYLGDAEIKGNVNIGASVITANFDGKEKHKTLIEENTFVGCSSTLVAPLTLGKDSFVAAGSVITKDVPSSSLSIARERQINKENYFKK